MFVFGAPGAAKALRRPIRQHATPSRSCPRSQRRRHAGALSLTASAPSPDAPHCASRRRFLSAAVLAAAAAALGIGAVRPSDAGMTDALARKLYPKPGINVEDRTEMPKVTDADRQRIKSQLDAVRAYRSALRDISAKFESAPQTADILTDMHRVFRFDALRDALNAVADANFDEEVQKRTDRIVRNILQDLNELQVAARMRANQSQRTPKRISAVRKWLAATATDFDKLLAYYGP